MALYMSIKMGRYHHIDKLIVAIIIYYAIILNLSHCFLTRLVYRSLYYVAGKTDKVNGVAYGSLEYSLQENGYDNNDN